MVHILAVTFGCRTSACHGASSGVSGSPVLLLGGFGVVFRVFFFVVSHGFFGCSFLYLFLVYGCGSRCSRGFEI